MFCWAWFWPGWYGGPQISLFSGAPRTSRWPCLYFSPSLIAHFSIAATDGAATLFIFAVAWSLSALAAAEPTLETHFVARSVAGPDAAGQIFYRCPCSFWPCCGCSPRAADKILRDPRQWNWGKAAAALVLALFVVWAGYFFHVSRLTVRDGTLTATFPNWSEPIVKPVHGRTNYSLLIPAGEYVEGFRELVRHNRHGQAAFFLGQVSSEADGNCTTRS